MRRKPLALLALALGAAFLLVGDAFAGTGLAPVDPQSPNAERSRDLYYVLLVVAGFVFLTVTVPLVLFIVRYRSRGRGREVDGPQVRGHTRLELAWTAVPVLILVAVVSFVFYKLPGIVDLEEKAEAGAPLEVNVEGRQFYWLYEYPNGVVAVDRLRAPLGRLVKLKITAPEGDVNHSFWVPPIGGKFDAIPGQTTETEFRAQKLGLYRGQCGEFCGIQHAAMLASIQVLPREEFDRWLASEARRQEARTSTLGAETYAGACAKCHGFEGQGLIGPPLAGNALVGERESVEPVVRNGRGRMPPVGRGWSDRQMDALMAYLKRELAQPQGTQGGG